MAPDLVLSPSELTSVLSAAAMPRLMSIEDVAEVLGMSPNTISDQRNNGGHPLFNDKAIKHGRRLKWRSTDVADYIASLPYADAA